MERNERKLCYGIISVIIYLYIVHFCFLFKISVQQIIDFILQDMKYGFGLMYKIAPKKLAKTNGYIDKIGILLNLTNPLDNKIN